MRYARRGCLRDVLVMRFCLSAIKNSIRVLMPFYFESNIRFWKPYLPPEKEKSSYWNPQKRNCTPKKHTVSELRSRKTYAHPDKQIPRSRTLSAQGQTIPKSRKTSALKEQKKHKRTWTNGKQALSWKNISVLGTRTNPLGQTFPRSGKKWSPKNIRSVGKLM